MSKSQYEFSKYEGIYYIYGPGIPERLAIDSSVDVTVIHRITEALDKAYLSGQESTQESFRRLLGLSL